MNLRREQPRPLVTLGLSSHRLETLPVAEKEMEKHDAIVLEEAPEADFARFLAGELSPEQYLEDKEVEFPQFARRQLTLLRELHREGKVIFQVEPYMERLTRIHYLLAEGLSREEVESQTEFREVYAAESRASRALLNFYAAAHTASFLRVVAAVKDFAQADAARFRLRDRLRAEALLPFPERFPRVYVEAGYIHLYLVKALARHFRGRVQLRPRFLLSDLSLKAIGRPRPLGPGDLLTLRYIFGVRGDHGEEDLLAARSLIYIMLLAKEELAPEKSPQPHLSDEIRALRLSARLSYQDCATLYPKVRRLTPAEALALVQDYLGVNEKAGLSPDAVGP